MRPITKSAPAVAALVTLVAVGLLSALSACSRQETLEATSDAERASAEGVAPVIDQLVQEITSQPQKPLPGWAIGPFNEGEAKGQEMVFRPELTWGESGAGGGWEPKAVWNPSLLEVDGRLYLFYRVGPALEGLNSRIAVAWSDDGVQWHDYEQNPILYPTEAYEELGVEDPEVYKHDGTYYLFYQAVWDNDEGDVRTDICLATSEDLLHWEKQGRVVPRSVSKGWAKSAAIPRSPEGEAVKIDGTFLMYISERPLVSDKDVEEQLIGYSEDLVHWEFEQEAYLVPGEIKFSAAGGQIKGVKSIYEVATAVTDFPDSDYLVLDFYYTEADGGYGCAQALYSTEAPTERRAFTEYGVCSWGGMIVYQGQWLFAQGWREPDAIQLYTAPTTSPNYP